MTHPILLRMPTWYIARSVLGVPPNVVLESINDVRGNDVLFDDISFSPDGKIAYIALSTS